MKISVKGCAVDIKCDLTGKMENQYFRGDVCEKVHGNQSHNKIHPIIIGPYSGQFKAFKTQLCKDLDSKISSKRIGTIHSIKLNKQ